MRKSAYLLLAAVVLVWSAAAQQTTESQSPAAATASPSQPQAGTGQPGVPITGESSNQNRNPQRGEDAGQQGKGVPTAGEAQKAGGAQAGEDENALPAGTPILATLSKTVDAKKAKQGDPVTAKVAQDVLREGEIILPRGTKLVGQVTEASPSHKGENPSSLGIAWEKAELRGGKEIPLHALIQAIAPSREIMPALNEGAPNAESGSMGPPGGTAGTMGGVPAGPPGASQPGMGQAGSAGEIGAPSGPAASRGGASIPMLNPRSSGAQGMPGVALAPGTSSAQGSQITSAKGNVRLESGSQLVLRVMNQ